MRVGLLATVVTSYFVQVLLNAPLTLDPSRWAFGRSLVILTALAAVVVFAFVKALGGKPAFAGSLASELER
jgi:energy-converting hydrogenase Eha subunit A